MGLWWNLQMVPMYDGGGLVVQRESEQYPNFSLKNFPLCRRHSARRISLTTLLYSAPHKVIPCFRRCDVHEMEEILSNLKSIQICVKCKERLLNSIGQRRWIVNTLERRKESDSGLFCQLLFKVNRIKINIGRAGIESICGQNCWYDFKLEIKTLAELNLISELNMPPQHQIYIEFDWRKKWKY